MLNWCKRFNIFLLLDSHNYIDDLSRVDWMLAAGASGIYEGSGHDALDQFEAFRQQHNDWLFGHASFDLKNAIEPLNSRHVDNLGFPDIFFFRPKILLWYVNGEIIIESAEGSPAYIFDEIQSVAGEPPSHPTAVTLQPRINRSEYLQSIQQLKQHIMRGDCYEINFCQEFFAEQASIDPFDVFDKLSAVSPTPFAAFYRINDKYLACASPERFLQRRGDTIISEPIKGTSGRDLSDASRDAILREQLASSNKEKAENVMIVDLVRNDLSRICQKGSVHVPKLFDIRTFPQVHQMVSTVQGTLATEITFTQILRATFPMGSMTGAPKRRVLELTEQYEHSRRGIYSGCVGYITPNGDFDLNVVIRSLTYNSSSGYLSCHVGGGITANSDPEQEYEECLVKFSAIKKVLQ